MEGSCHGLVIILSWHLSAETEEKNEKSIGIVGPTFELRTSRVPRKSANNLAATYVDNFDEIQHMTHVT
jgi:hypothetical protein